MARHAPRRFRPVAAALVVLLATAAATPSRADDDHMRARAARQAGEIRPLTEIIAAVRRDNPGEIVEIELEHEHGRWIYEVKILTPQGEIRRLDYDARSAERLSGPRPHRPEHRRR